MISKKYILLFILIFSFVTYLGYRFINHEIAQNKKIRNLIGQVSYLKNKIKQVSDYYDFVAKYESDSFNYFAIGNSLTLIPSWGRGICSTKPDNDYYNILLKYLKSKHNKVVAYPYNFASWERAENRDSTLDLLKPFLKKELNLVTIQLGENCGNYIDTYQKDLESLINYVKKISPKAEIIIIGDWWNIKRNQLRQNASNNTNCKFVDLSEIINNPEYQSKTGLDCYLADGSIIKVSSAASTHPGDKGMEFIATKVIKVLNTN